MLITCPTCASSYKIDAAKLGPEGRSVRCAACRETWFIPPGEPEDAAQEAGSDAAPEQPADPVADAAWADAAAAVRETQEPEGPPPPAAEPRRVKRRPAVKARKPPATRIPLSPAVLMGLAALAIVPVSCLARNSVAGLVPQTASVFKAIGLPVNRRGLEFRDVVAFQNPRDEDKPAELVVEGDLVGIAQTGAPVPEISVDIVDAAGKVVKTFSASAPRSTLAASETARFHARLANPPSSGRTVAIKFADAAAKLGETAGKTGKDRE